MESLKEAIQFYLSDRDTLKLQQINNWEEARLFFSEEKYLSDIFELITNLH